MIEVQDDLTNDIKAVKQIPIVSTMLEVVCQTTGMGFAAVARVTEDRWIACSVRDEVEFGLEEGGELKVETTICNEIRDSRQAVVIENVDKDPLYKGHHTPEMYGLQSYISVPIILKNGTFFGTLCAIDSKPANIKNKKVIGTFHMFAELLAFHLESVILLDRSYQEAVELKHENSLLAQINEELDTFVYTASHDLKSPIHNIRGLVNALSDTIAQKNIDRAKANKIMEMIKSSLQRLGLTIQDLTTIVKTEQPAETSDVEKVSISETVERVKQDLDQQIKESKAVIKVDCEEDLLIKFSKKNFKSVLYNLVSNAIKYRSTERSPEVCIKTASSVDGKIKLTITDNGIGIPEDKLDKIFTLFKRVHSHVEGNGIGLYLVKRMVDKVNGQIQVTSTPNKGSCFTITF